ADALLEAVLEAVQPVPAAEARIHRPLVLRVLLRDRLLDDLLQRHAEALQGVRDGGHQWTATTRAAVTRAFTVAAGSRTFQPKRISWSYRRRGCVARSQMKTETSANSFSTNQTGPTMSSEWTQGKW